MTAAANRDFIRRIHAAIDMNPDAPSGHGRQKWLRDRIMARAGKDLSPEAVRKWFAGEARPRRATMAILASALNADLAWLTLGDRTEAVKRQGVEHSSAATGLTNLVAGMMQTAGRVVEFDSQPGQQPIEDFVVSRGAVRARIHVRRIPVVGDVDLVIDASRRVGNDWLVVGRLLGSTSVPWSYQCFAVHSQWLRNCEENGIYRMRISAAEKVMLDWHPLELLSFDSGADLADVSAGR
ncbi:hypothetical protein [Rhizobium sp. BK176]|uniref:hypothetical protein n=1 Tax=Rhizobium sp. BK176 TaxID=2587071 RepID=UPI00216A1FD7|nr:hypothetical protein [Rhizobium sp. BK176]MCS4089340.1 hypothetical protein [Rhizobium sp. BK176]